MAKYRCFTARCKWEDGNPWIGDESELVSIGMTNDFGNQVSILRAPCGHEGTLRKFRRLQDDFELKSFKVNVGRSVESNAVLSVVAPTAAIAQDDAIELAENSTGEFKDTGNNFVILSYREETSGG